MIKTANNIQSVVSAGSLVGEITALHHLPAMETYRALTFVNALKIPATLYREIVDKYKLFSDILRLMEGREFLQNTWLFGEAISYSTQNRVADSMACRRLEAGEEFKPLKKDGVGILKEGSAKLYCGRRCIEIIGRGDIFGEDSLINDQRSKYSIVADEAMEFCSIPVEILKEIPIVQWKLIESLERRRHLK